MKGRSIALKPLVFAGGLLTATIFTAPVSSAATIRFEQPQYTVRLGESLIVNVAIDFDVSDPAFDLFSFGVRLLPAPGVPLAVPDISVVTPLDNFGPSGSAFVDLSPTVLGAKGNVSDFSTPYAGRPLFSATLVFNQVGTFPIGLTFFNTLGPTEQIFVGGNASVLDPQIAFEGTSVRVVPEPGAPLLLACGIVTGALLTRRRGS